MTQQINDEFIGKNVLVRANVAGVHVGEVVALDLANSSILLKNAYRLWRYYTRDKSGSVSDLVANGLIEGKDHQIGTRLDKVLIVNPPGLEIDIMHEGAHESVVSHKNAE